MNFTKVKASAMARISVGLWCGDV